MVTHNLQLEEASTGGMDEAYSQAWEALNAQYGHPFVIQRAFRDKLNNWPKIGSRESVKVTQ